MTVEIKKVRRSGLQKVITIPTKSKIKEGDYVWIELIEKDNHDYYVTGDGELKTPSANLKNLKEESVTNGKQSN